MNCNSFQKISPFAEQIRGSMRQAFDIHIKNCSECRDIEKRIALVEHELSTTSYPTIMPRDDFSARIIGRLQNRKKPMAGNVLSFCFMVIAFIVSCYAVLMNFDLYEFYSFISYSSAILEIFRPVPQLLIIAYDMPRFLFFVFVSCACSFFTWALITHLTSPHETENTI